MSSVPPNIPHNIHLPGNVRQGASRATSVAGNGVSRVAGSASRKALGLGAIAVAYLMMRDSVRGSRDLWEQRYQAYQNELSMDQFRFNAGFYSGHPGFDSLAVRLKRVVLYGPFKLRASGYRIKAYTEGFINEILLPNLPFIGLGFAGLYGGFGARAVHAPFRAVARESRRAFGAPLNSARQGLRNWGVGRHLADGLGKSVGKILDFAAKSVSNGRWAVTLPLLGLGYLGLDRFWKVYSGDSQREFFGYNDYSNQ
ncbi:MAG: hypothetical protein AB7P76_10045 [Candidatus Melainabacteria bacterium]